MKTSITNVKRLCTLLLAALAFAACSNENDDIAGQEPVQPVNGDITFTAVFGVKNATTRALSDPGDGTLTASWQQGEEIAIVFNSTRYVATVTSVDGAGIATVSATLPGNTPNNQAVTFIYPASAVDEYGTPNDLFSSQDGTLATLSSTLDLATAEGNIVIDGTNAQPNGTVTLVNKFAVCKFQFKDENDRAITDVKKLTITDLATQDKYTFTMSTAQSAVYAAMQPSNNSMKFKVETASGKLYLKTASANLQAGMFYHPTLQIIKSKGEYVDLGLPSGTLWATYNVGANSPEEYGDYFAWGETEPKSVYNWNGYKYCTSVDNKLTKYCTQSDYGNYGFTDTLTELTAEDDAATANWGSDWQMPSQEQIEELYRKTTTTWTTQSGVYGWLFTAGNGKSIFLPAAGYRNGTSLASEGSDGHYWSRSLHPSYSEYAYNLYSISDGIDPSGFGTRCYGYSVRPVLKQ
jgi:hypothetical protein